MQTPEQAGLADTRFTQEAPPPKRPRSPAQDGRGVQYHSADFDFEAWALEVETDGRGLNACASPQQERQEPGEVGDELGLQVDAWENFHQQHHHGTFFKERRYLLAEFEEDLAPRGDGASSSVLEIGCGSGSSVIPLLKGNQNLQVYATDFSAQAVQATRDAVASLPGAQAERCTTFVCDVSTQRVVPLLASAAVGLPDGTGESVPTPVGRCGQEAAASLSGAHAMVDSLLMVFVLSAVHPRDCTAFLRNACEVLREGGRVLFRDYGLYDMTMLRFPPSQRVGDRLYVRQDGTISRIFTKADVAQLCAEAGLVLVRTTVLWGLRAQLECEYHCVEVTNRKKKTPMRRVFIHARLEKPRTVATTNSQT